MISRESYQIQLLHKIHLWKKFQLEQTFLLEFLQLRYLLKKLWWILI